MLKFEGRFKVGDVIKAYDFPPGCHGVLVGDSYILGRVVDADNMEHGFKAYKVIQLLHIIAGEDQQDEFNTEAWIPMEVSFGEYDERIQKYSV